MGEQIIVQPDGKLAIFSSIVDDFIILDATPPELMEWRANRAADEAREATRAEIGRVHVSLRPYRQFTLTWEEAVAKAGFNPVDIPVEHVHVLEHTASWPSGPDGETDSMRLCACGEEMPDD